MCTFYTTANSLAPRSQNFFEEDQAQDQLRPLNGSLDLNLKSGVHETYLSPGLKLRLLNGSSYNRYFSEHQS